MTPNQTKQLLEQRRNKIIREIKQIFLDAEHWNRCVRAADEAEIDVDPNGELRDLLARLEGSRSAGGGSSAPETAVGSNR